MSASSSESKNNTQSPILFENEDDIDEMVTSLLRVSEIDGNAYQIESILKQWFHDYSTDSDHLRLSVGHAIIRCDIKECMLNADSLPVSGQFCLLPDGSIAQNVVRPIASNKQTSASKVPVYEMDAVAVVQKEGLCESLLFGHSYITTATRCWKIDWDELDRNQQLFLATARHLHEKNQVLIAKKKTTQIAPSSEKVLPAGFFAFFPAKNMMLIRSVAPNELILPNEELPEREIPYEVVVEAKEYLESLEHKTVYNPLTMISGLYPYLTSSQIKRMRPSTNFVTPIVSGSEERIEGKKRKKTSAATEIHPVRKPELPFNTSFMTASALLKHKFPQDFD